MVNVAGKPTKETDDILREELIASGIEVIEHSEILGHPEVSTHISGKLGEIIFRRNWYYWVVKCEIPLEIAQEIYADSIGRKEIRVAGHCGCPAPEDPWVQYEKDGQPVEYESKKPKDWEDPCWDRYRDKFIFVEDPKTEPGVKAFIGSYHIDSVEGLRVFADTIKKRGVA